MTPPRGQPGALVVLRGRPVHFEDPQAGRPGGLAIRERVEPGAEHDELSHAAGHRLLEAILRIAAADDHVCPQGAGAGRLQGLRVGVNPFDRPRIEEPRRNPIVEDRRPGVDDLVGGTQPNATASDVRLGLESIIALLIYHGSGQ